MLRTASLARRSTIWRWLRASLVVGALYDLVLSAALLVAPGRVCVWLAVPPPTEAFYLLALAGVFLAMFGGCHLLAASDIRRYFDLVAIFILGRLAAAAVFAWFAWKDPRLSSLSLLAAMDAGLALFSAAPWWVLYR